ncbi:hypothetical protein LCGC14_0278450 [marine sediment metagenome]|uniref:Uncharacterized protein n=1 Tax=marine sediment metagenome TaxID=412755 RepID=A0A0F9UDQ7_9ZZZZ
MTFSFEDLVNIGEIVADACLEVGDPDMRQLTPGWYRKTVKRALDELSFDVPFIKVVRDIVMPDDMKVSIPKGFYNIENIHIYTGTPDNIKYVENVYWKRNFQTRGGTIREDKWVASGYTANNHEHNITDPFFKVSALRQSPHNAYYFNTRNGIIYLSSACSGYDYVRIIGKGVATSELDIDKIKIVPPFAAEAVLLWTVERAARALKVNDSGNRRLRTIQTDAALQLDKYGFNGAWHEAKVRLGSLDKKKWRDLVEYSSKMTE